MDHANLETALAGRLRRADFRPNAEKTALDVTIFVDGGARVRLGAWDAGGAYELAAMMSDELAAAPDDPELVGVFPIVDAPGVDPRPYAFTADRRIALAFSQALAVESARLLARRPTSGQSVWLDAGGAVRAAVEAPTSHATEEDDNG
jgi:hypothetical protein